MLFFPTFFFPFWFHFSFSPFTFSLSILKFIFFFLTIQLLSFPARIYFSFFFYLNPIFALPLFNFTTFLSLILNIQATKFYRNFILSHWPMRFRMGGRNYGRQLSIHRQWSSGSITPKRKQQILQSEPLHSPSTR